MCAITGMVSSVADASVSAAVQAMTASLAHRGPDDEGRLEWTAGGEVRVGRDLLQGPAHVALGHRRLAIIDTGVAGWQPMRSRCGRFHVVFNGEVFNHPELRDQLVELGHRFDTRTDTEVLLAAWSQWGEGALSRFVGMFAFAMFDAGARRLLLVRDPFGIKPLYYMSGRGQTVFASEIQPLLDLPWARRHVDAQAVFDYLRFGAPRHPESTFFADVHAVPAGHVVDLSLDAPDGPVRSRRYWQPTVEEDTDITFEEAAAHLRQLLTESVRLHLRSDVPVGVSVSGGLDSSAILMLLREVCGAQGSIVGFGYAAGGAFDETRWMQMAADSSGIPLRQVAVDGRSLAGSLDRLLRIQGEPFGSTSILAQHRVFEAASRSGIKVMLGGQGADELFGGYRAFVAVRLATLLRHGRVAEAVTYWRHVRRLPDVNHVLLRSGAALLPDSMHDLAHRAFDRGAHDVIDASWFERAGVETVFPAVPCVSSSRLKDRLVDALQTRVLPALLRHEDRNAMAFSIENRVPFLTTTIAQFALSLPDEYLIDGTGRQKAVLRAAMRGLVPGPIVDRTDKIAFLTPESEWLDSASGWVDQALESPAARSVAAVRVGRVRERWAQWRVHRHRHDPALWRAVSLVRWAELVGAEFVV